MLTQQTYCSHWPVVAGVILVDASGRLLLQHRDSNAPTSPNKWCQPGGHLEEGETALEAASRELLEETGLAMGDTLSLFRHFLVVRAANDSVYFVEDGQVVPPGATIIRDVSIFYGLTAAQKSDLVLGEGDALAFVPPGDVLQLELALSASYILPIFLQSPEYRSLLSNSIP